MVKQLSFGSSLGFEEAKIAQPRTNNHDFCHDLLRLAMFCKEIIDKNYLTGCISFQIHGFTIIFYLMQLQHDGIYTMLEIARLAFPRSLAELSTFVSLKNLVSLMQVSDVFWRICQPCLDEDRSQLISSRRPSHPDIHKLIDGTKIIRKYYTGSLFRHLFQHLRDKYWYRCCICSRGSPCNNGTLTFLEPRPRTFHALGKK
ncbi:hypothetical protein BDC45DRAFT_318316 [Circinella umbellata]|nr:hypothetical protein BDC45DRAFT_356803 [Circinella umbellata]KAI7848393.1 hypothetical protein BDC45DRAFT_318316 [Circinella umbellata]